jgi:hypothetical protein
MKKNSDKKPKESKAGKKKNEPRPEVKTKAQRGLDEFLENKRIERERIEEERQQAKELAKGRTSVPPVAKKAPVEKPVVLERDLRTRDLVDKFYGGDEDSGMQDRVEEVPEEIIEETVVETPGEVVAKDIPVEMVAEEVEEVVFTEELEPVAELVESELEPETSSEKAEELVYAEEAEPVETSSEARQALLDTMKMRSVGEERKVTPKDKEKAERVNKVLDAAEGLYKGTRKATRGTLDFAGGVAKGSVDVAAAITGGVFGLVGQGVLGVARVAGIGYRGVSFVTSGISKGISGLAESGKDEKKKGLIGAVASGISKKTSSFLCIEDGKKGPN